LESKTYLVGIFGILFEPLVRLLLDGLIRIWSAAY